MKNVYDKIWSTPWKYLIVLDACRYDYFERIYKEYLPEGKLEKLISCGWNTPEWLKCVFRGKAHNDIVYISANPYINSKGTMIINSYIDSEGKLVWKFNPRNYIRVYKIIDVWDWGFNKELGTVHPKEVNKAALIAVRLYRLKRFIIHYAQPHYPYLELAMRGIKIKINRRFSDRVKGFIRWRLINLFGKRAGLKIAEKIIGPPSPQRPEEQVARKLGEQELRRLYKSNLRIVLKYVARLISRLKEKIIITSDHGELLGEQGLYGHRDYNDVPILFEVPWLEIDKL